MNCKINLKVASDLEKIAIWQFDVGGVLETKGSNTYGIVTGSIPQHLIFR